MTKERAHVLALAIPACHSKPLVVLASRIVRRHPSATVTIFVVGMLFEKLVKERDANIAPYENSDELAKRINVVGITEFNDDIFASMKGMFESFPAVYSGLIKDGTVTCKMSQNTLSNLPFPSVFILDPFSGFMPVIRSVTEKKVPVLAWMSGPPSTGVFRLYGPEKYGGIGDMQAKIEAEVARTGRPLPEVGDEIMRKTDGSIVHVPGMPDMYDYEAFPQKCYPGVTPLVMGTYRFFLESDGLMLTIPASYEPEATAGAREWYTSMGDKPVFPIGPLFPPDMPHPLSKSSAKDSSDDYVKFLNELLEKHGERSLVYVSFGSNFWPDDITHLEAAIDALIELKVPFIFSHASPFAAVLPDSLKQKIESSGLGVAAKWSPQNTILSHPVTGLFITHGGANSIAESLSQGIPMIFWPFDADQPLNAAHVAINLQAGYELFEPRYELKGKPILSRGPNAPPIKATPESIKEELKSILEKAKGGDGERVRKKAREAGDKLWKAWEKGGESDVALDQFIERYL